MAQLNVTKQGAEAMTDNPSRVDVADYTSGFREFKPTTHRDDWRTIAARAGAGLAVVLVLWLAYGIWKSLYCWLGGWEAHETCRTITRLEPLALLLAALTAGGVVLWRTLQTTRADLRQKHAYANRTNLVLDRFGNQTPADLFDRMAPEAIIAYLERRYAIDVSLKRATAPHERYWGVNALTEGDRAEPEALPAPDAAPLVPIDEWLGWVNEQPHVILAAETGGGKSTTAKAILAPRIDGGEQVFIIDPHSDSWFDLPIVGGGENWSEVRAALEAVSDEYQRRIAERDRHLRATGQALGVEHWTRLTVLLDEAFITRVMLDTGRKGEVTPWQQFAKVLGSGARKVRISIVLLTQSANVEDLGLSGPMRENFLRLALDSAAARKLITAEEPNAERRQLLYAAIEGQQYPAVCEYRGQVYALDRTGLDRVAAPKDARRAAWRPQLVAPVAADDATLEILRSLRAAGWTRKEVRASGLQFDNDLWAQAEP